MNKPQSNTMSMAEVIDYSTVKSGASAAPQTELPWSSMIFAGIFIAMIAFHLGRWFEREMERRRKVDELVKKQERDDAQLIVQARKLQEDGAGEIPSRSKPVAVAPVAPVVVAPPAVGAAPARHHKTPQPQQTTAPAIASLEAASMGEPHQVPETFDSDTASIMSGVGAPISPGAGEAVAAFLREQAKSA